MSTNSEDSEADDFSFNEEFSFSNDVSKLKPYDFEPIVSSGESSNEDYIDQEENSSSASNSRVGNILWCKCDECKNMTTEAESICCVESNEIPDDFFEGKKCVTKAPGYHMICIEQRVLETAMTAINELAGKKLKKKNENYRYAGYRQFIWWIHSRLGKGVRRVIPSCVVWAIRNKYPSPG